MLTEKELIDILVKNFQKDLNRIPVLDSDLFNSVIGSMRDAISKSEEINTQPPAERYFIVYYFASIKGGKGKYAHGNCVYRIKDGSDFMNRESIIKELKEKSGDLISLSITGYNEISQKEYESWIRKN